VYRLTASFEFRGEPLSATDAKRQFQQARA